VKTIIISDSEFTEIAERDESHFFDIKRSDVSGTVQKIAAAFSNADGGELIIGVKDKKTGEPINERWEGITDIEKLNGHLQALFEITPPRYYV
jgi:ATP-dependent DNA helicase RecG